MQCEYQMTWAMERKVNPRCSHAAKHEVDGKKLCTFHAKRAGSPDLNNFPHDATRTNREAAADITAEQLERFWLRVDKSGPIPAQRPELGPCWIWTRCLNSDGYGNVRLSGRQRRTHIVAWELNHGPVPEGLELDHLCRVRCCLNPAHLEPVTRAENHRRGLGSKVGCKVAGALQRAKTHCPKGHPYGGENLYVATDGRRHCRVCQRESHRRYMSKRRMREKTCPPVRPY